MSSAIEIRGLVKRFGQHVALDELDLTVAAGEVHGFLGPNGSGKSTTIRVLLGQLGKDAGEVRILGLDPWYDAPQAHRQIAYVPGDVALWPTLTGGETIDLLARLRGGVDARRRAELIDRFDLDPTKKARAYSKGNRQKVAIIAAFSRPADLFVLDEPTAGLDPLMEKHFQDTLVEARADGATVLLSSHILSEVEHACDQISIIRAGRIVESGSMAQLRHLTRTSIHAVVDGDPQRLAALPGIHDLRIDGRRVELDVDDADLQQVVRALSDLGVRSLESQPPSLEEIFLRHYGDAPAPGPATAR
ncbi:ABC transporter ATP-binding protein [Cumulibacter manganitolerans]|uniref:ABC transporter ATP-binding protein n=1 Tax=Cumulibacter manganitolerans TaxID=1884992 RepID=UPI0012961C87|nr:ABC transporter ATP-binding protein [Cumulibacter manganitolerans]